MMKKTIIISLLLSLMVVIAGCSSASKTGNTLINGETVTVYKDKNCGCCGNYAAGLTREGYDVETIDSENMNTIKGKYNIPLSMQSCHTTVIGDYFIEGHIPYEAVIKLLTEKPDIDGIAMPGMPSGSPGMPGAKLAPFEIYAVTDGEMSPYMTI